MEPSTEQIESFRTIGDIREWAGFTLAGDPGDVGPTFLELLGVEAASPFVDLAAVTAADFNVAVGTWRTGAGSSAGTNTTLQQRTIWAWSRRSGPKIWAWSRRPTGLLQETGGIARAPSQGATPVPTP